MKKLSCIIIIFTILIILATPSTAYAVDDIAIAGCNAITGMANYVVKCIQKVTLNAVGFDYNVATGNITVMSNPGPIQQLINEARVVIPTVMALAVVFFGIKITAGGVREIKGETGILILKLIGVGFLASVNGIAFAYNFFIGLTTAVTNLFSAFAEPTGNCLGLADIWVRMDCSLYSMLGTTQAIARGTASIASQNIPIFITTVALMFVSGLGIFILAFAVAVVLLVLSMFAIALFAYLVPYIGIIFLVAILPFLAPTILFEKTKSMMSHWFQFIIAYSLQPMAVVGFLALAVTAINTVLYGTGIANDPEALYPLLVEFTTTPGLLTWQPVTISFMNTVNIPVFIRPEITDPVWAEEKMPLLLVNLAGMLLLVGLLFAFMKNVINFASDMVGMGASTESLANKLNVVYMAQKIGKASIKVGAGAVKGAVKGALKGGVKGAAAGAAVGAVKEGAKQVARNTARELKG